MPSGRSISTSGEPTMSLIAAKNFVVIFMHARSCNGDGDNILSATESSQRLTTSLYSTLCVGASHVCKRECLSKAHTRALGGLTNREKRSGGYELLLSLSEEISHERTDHVSDSAVVERSGIGCGREPACAGSDLELAAVRPKELSALGVLSIDAELHHGRPWVRGSETRFQDPPADDEINIQHPAEFNNLVSRDSLGHALQVWFAS